MFQLPKSFFFFFLPLQLCRNAPRHAALHTGGHGRTGGVPSAEGPFPTQSVPGVLASPPSWCFWPRLQTRSCPTASCGARGASGWRRAGKATLPRGSPKSLIQQEQQMCNHHRVSQPTMGKRKKRRRKGSNQQHPQGALTAIYLGRGTAEIRIGQGHPATRAHETCSHQPRRGRNSPDGEDEQTEAVTVGKKPPHTYEGSHARGRQHPNPKRLAWWKAVSILQPSGRIHPDGTAAPHSVRHQRPKPP